MERPSTESIIRGSVIAVAALAVIAAPVILFTLYGNEGLQAASIITSGLLSLTLIVLYFQQYNLLDRQTELMKQEFETSLAIRGLVYADEDEIYVDLRNVGRGTIRYVYLRSELISDTGSLTVKPARYQLSAVEDDTRSLPGFCEAREFKGEVKMTVEDPENDRENRYPFRFVSGKLVDEGIVEGTIRLTLETVDETQQSDEDYGEFVIAEQEIDLGSIEEEEVEAEDVEMDTIVRRQSNTLSGGLRPIYGSSTDIVPRNSAFFNPD